MHLVAFMRLPVEGMSCHWIAFPNNALSRLNPQERSKG